jgi:hypothetical protein
MSTFGAPLYGETRNNTQYFLNRLIQTLPEAHRPPEALDFLQRLLLPSAEELDYVNGVFDLLDTYVLPESAPEEWVRWLLDRLGWTLVPDGYPVDPRSPQLGIESSPCLRRLLKHLYLHYERRYTVTGIRELLKEFGVIALVYDRRMKVKACARQRGSVGSLHVRVVIIGYEPFYFPARTGVKCALGPGGLRAHTTRQIITDEFVMSLIHWSRAAGVAYRVEWLTGIYRCINLAPIPDDEEITVA